MGGTFARVLGTLILIGLIVAIGVGVYNAGVSAGLAQTVVVPSGAPVAYYPGPYVWHGWGFGIFGIFFWILGIFLIFALLRAIFGWGRWRGRGHRDWSYRPNGYGGPREHFDDWHRRAHEPGSTGSEPPASGS
jgi:hypothetical protein